jgi:hypothetical protein
MSPAARSMPWVAVGGAMLACSTVASAQSAPTARLRWSTDVACIDAPSVRREVGAILGRDPFRDDPRASFDLEGRAAPSTAGALAVEVRMHDEPGTLVGVRTVEARSCDELAPALAVVVAMMIESPELDVHLAIPPEAERTVGDDVALVAGASVLAVAGLGAPLLAGGGLVVGARSRRLGLEGHARLDVLGAPVVFSDAPVALVGLRGELAICLELGAPEARIGACAWAGASWGRAQGVGFDVSLAAEVTGIDVGASARGTIAIAGPVLLRIELGLLVPLARARLEVLEPDGARAVIWDGWPVAPALRIEGVVELPEVSGSAPASAHSSR